jgi:hypothetical protein
MTTIDATRPVPFTTAGDETETLLSTIDCIRGTFVWKCGVGTRDMVRRLEPSTLTLGGLLRHMGYLEDAYFSGRMRGQDPTVHWPESGTDGWEWDVPTAATADDLIGSWRAAVQRSRRAVATVLEGDSFDALTVQPVFGTIHLNLRRIVADLIEEYARHTGHADLIPESIDGVVGEDAPRDEDGGQP